MYLSQKKGIYYHILTVEKYEKNNINSIIACIKWKCD